MNFGAVAYLNMLPFFYSNKEIVLAKSPRELNTGAREGSIDCACMSVIAGIRSGFKPVFPFVGVGSENRVRSVYLDALPMADASRLALPETQKTQGRASEIAELPDFWGQFCIENKGHLEHFSMATPPVAKGRVHLFTAGASEHSEWLACVLLWTQGYETSVHRIDASANFESSQVLAERYAHVCNGEPAALLVIGDPALARVRRFPHMARCRLDLATLWNSFSGLPCLFATWFDARPAQAVPLSAEHLVESVNQWNAQSDFARWCVVREFLQGHSPALLESYASAGESLLRDDVLDYLSYIVCVFDERYEKTYELYCKLNTAYSASLAAHSTTLILPQGEGKNGLLANEMSGMKTEERVLGLEVGG